MTFINIDLYHNGSNQTDHVITYNREQFICSGIGTLAVELVDTGRNYDPWDEIVLYEEGTKKGTYYIREVVREIGSLKLDCQDASLRLSEYFISDTYSFPYVTTARYWIERFINDAGVDYTFTTSENGAPINVDAPFGVSTSYEVVMQMLQMSNWYMFFDPNGRCIIGSLTLSTGHPDARVEDDSILDLQFNTNDKMLRNRAVVWGGADLVYGTWVFADLTVNTPWNYDANDQRAVVLANQSIQTYYDANRLARQILVEFSKITEEKTVSVVGELNVAIGDYVFIDSEFFSGGGMVTTLSSQMGKNGFITVLTLDQRCPRLFAFIGNYDDYVYIGTAGSGVWRKGLDESVWYNYSTGLTDLGITDLSINSGIFATTTNSGYLFYKTLYTNWMLYSPDQSYFVPSGSAAASGIVTLSGITPSGYYASCCTLDKMNYTIYAAYVTESGIFASGYLASGDINAFSTSSGESWIIQIDSFGRFLRSDKVVFTNNYGSLLERVTVIDMDNNGSENLLSVIASGPLVPVVPGDDGFFGYVTMVGPIRDIRAKYSDDDYAIGDHSIQRYLFSTDRETMVSTLPPSINDFDTLPFVDASLDAIAMGYNYDDDLGTWWGIDGSFITHWEWYDDGINRYLKVIEEWEITEPNFPLYTIKAILKESDYSFIILCGDCVFTIYSNTVNYIMYRYNTYTRVLDELDSINYSFSVKRSRSAAEVTNGNLHVISFYAVDGGYLNRYIITFNLYAKTISTHIDYYSTSENVERTFPQTPVIVGRYIVFVLWHSIMGPAGGMYSAWGELHFVADSIDKFTGERSRSDDIIYQQEPDCGGTNNEQCCDWGVYPTSPTPTRDYNGVSGWDGLWTLNRGWVAQNDDDSLTAWNCFAIQQHFIKRSGNCEVYSDSDIYPDKFYFHRIKIYFSPPGTAILTYHESNDIWENNGYTINEDTKGYYNWEYAGNLSEFNYDADAYFCGSSERNVWYMIKPKHAGAVSRDYEIWDIWSNIPALVGTIHYPDDFPDVAGASTYYINGVVPQVDDEEGTIYILWKYSGTHTYLVGHSPYGAVTKKMMLDSSCSATSYNCGWGIYGNNVVAESMVGRYFDYEQPMGVTVRNYIVKQKENNFQCLYDAGVKLGVDTSKSAPTVIYHPPMSGPLSLNISLIGVSYTNESGSFNVQATTFPINDVRVFDIATSSGFVVESGAQDLETFRYIGFVNSGGFFAIDAALASLNILSVVTPSGAMASGVMSSGVMGSGLIKLETSNYSPNTPYFFLASPSGFWQRNPGENFFYDYSPTLPGASITIIRIDDRL